MPIGPGGQQTWTHDMDEELYEYLEALRAKKPQPTIKMSMAIKGPLTPDRILQVYRLLSSDDEIEIKTTLKWDWEKHWHPDQLALWPKPTLMESQIREIADGNE